MTALKIFLLSLISGAGGGYLAFRVAFFLALRFWKGDNAELIAMAAAVLSALVVGCASAVTAGVLAGKATRA